MNLASIVEGHDEDRPALIDEGRVVTFGDLRSRAAAMRARLRDLGVGPGHHVAVICGNETDFVVAVLGILGVGAVAAPVNPYSPLAELQRKLEPVGPSAITVGDTARWVLGEASAFDAPLLDMASVTVPGEDTPDIHDVDHDAVAFLLSTSGVSGVPKVAALTHGNLAWAQEAISGDGKEMLRADDVSLGVLPFAHVLGLNVVLLASLRVGALVVLQRRFDVDESLELVRRHGVTQLTGAPPMWQRWAEADAPADSLATVRFARSGAAGLGIDVFERLRDRYGVEIKQGYGLTETASVVATGRGLDVRPTSVGKPLPGVQIVLVDEAGAPVDIGDLGEIVLRGPGVFAGYLDDPEATATVLTHDGWFWTGDVGVYDDDGYLYLVDRVKDIIIVSGFNVYPAEVESVLMEHPDVRGVVVVGTPHGETGETVVAHVSGSVTAEELDAFAASHLSRYKRPTRYHFVDELPSAAHGKTIRREFS